MKQASFIQYETNFPHISTKIQNNPINTKWRSYDGLFRCFGTVIYWKFLRSDSGLVPVELDLRGPTVHWFGMDSFVGRATDENNKLIRKTTCKTQTHPLSTAVLKWLASLSRTREVPASNLSLEAS